MYSGYQSRSTHYGGHQALDVGVYQHHHLSHEARTVMAKRRARAAVLAEGAKPERVIAPANLLDARKQIKLLQLRQRQLAARLASADDTTDPGGR